MKLIPYLSFDGNCCEAMNYYKDIFGGNLEIMNFADAHGDAGGAEEVLKDKSCIPESGSDPQSKMSK